MAVTWKGSTVTPPIACSPVSGEYVFALVNTFRSRHTINVLRFIAMGDSTEVSTTAGHIMPLLRTQRCTCANISGGVEIVRRPAWDTNTDAPSPHVKLLYSGYGVSEANRITATPAAGIAWQQFTQRGATNAEQRRTIDSSMLSRLTSVEDFTLAPGQAIVVSWLHGVAPVGGSIFFNIAWEENQTDTGYAVAGNVKLSGVNQAGAKVLLVTDTDQDLPNPELEILTTDSGGNFTKTVSSAVKASVFVQYRDGTDKYTDEGKPYIGAP
jgi:hypothetical protein